MRTRRALLAAVAAGLLAGCPAPRPVAPPLTTDAVYQGAAGLRFLVPQGWNVISRAEAPPGPLAKPLVLVSYGSGASSAALQVLAADLPEGADVGAHLAENPVGSDRWAPQGKPAAVSVNGVPATRYLLNRVGGPETRREATAFRRGGRVYVFLLTHAAADREGRDAGRKAVESASWAD